MKATVCIDWLKAALAEGEAPTEHDISAARAVQREASPEDAALIGDLLRVFELEPTPEAWPADPGSTPRQRAAVAVLRRPVPEMPPAVRGALDTLWMAIERRTAPTMLDLPHLRRVMRANPDHGPYLAHLLGLIQARWSKAA